MQCRTCNQETTNPKFCSRSCAAKYNNRFFPKRQKSKQCSGCQTLIFSNVTYCHKCFKERRLKDWSKVSYGEAVGARAYQRHSRIRALARSAFLAANPQPSCKVCGYSTHIDVCHITPIGGFEDTTPITTINSLNNLVALCKNHHWEFDNGIIPL